MIQKEITIKKANLLQINEIYDLYQSVHINEENLKNKIDSNHPNNFSKTGGIFYKPDKAYLKKIIKSKHYDVLVALSNRSKKVIGYASFHLGCIERFRKSDIKNYNELTVNDFQHFIDYLIIGKTVYAMDMIIESEWRRKYICLSLQNYEYSSIKNKYSYVFYEIYSIINQGMELLNPNYFLAANAFNTKRIGYFYKVLKVGSNFVNIKSDYHLLRI